MDHCRHLEIACFSVESAIIAHNAGASRIELCAEPSLGGTTPALADVQAVKRAVGNTPVHIMIRPRGGGFVYTALELQQMRDSIAELRPWADGFVFGVLGASASSTAANQPVEADIATCSALTDWARQTGSQHDSTSEKLNFTFHRAFDEIENWRQSLLQLDKCGFSAILVSGRKDAKAIDHAALLHQMVLFSREQHLRIQVIIGGSVRSTNLPELITEIDASWYHSSAILSGGNTASEVEVRMLKSMLNRG